ncbi:MAG: hypothetical protein VCA74_05400 [Deltaproteobacteria bacterium]
MSGDDQSVSCEQRLEALAEDMARVIGASPAADRESLHDYAVSLVRERLPVAAELYDEGVGGEVEGEEKAATSTPGVGALGYGVLMFLIGPFLLMVFPPVGMMILAAGVVLFGWGLVSALFHRIKPKISE